MSRLHTNGRRAAWSTLAVLAAFLSVPLFIDRAAFGQDAGGGPFALDEGSANSAGLPQADDDSSEAALVFVHVGQRIRHRRWMMGISQDQLGELLGAKIETIQQLETGSSRISADHMREIAAAMDIPVSFFVEGLDEQIPDTDTARRDTLQD